MKTILFTALSIFLLTPTLAFAQQNLVNLPIGETGDFNDYINAVYLMFISIAALIAVIKIIIAGVKYMFSDIVTQKSEAKRDIQGALLGLLVVLAAVVVLTIINPDLTTFDPEIRGLQEGQPRSIDRSTINERLDSITTFDTTTNDRWIPNDSTQEERLVFSENCVRNEGQLEATGDRLTCSDPDERAIALNNCDVNPGITTTSSGRQIYYCPTDAVSVADNVVAIVDGSESVRSTLIAQNYSLIPGGGSDPFPSDDTDASQAAVQNCQSLGGDYVQFYEQGSSLFIECYRSPQ